MTVDRSRVLIQESRMENLNSGGILVSQESLAIIEKTSFVDINGVAVNVMKKSIGQPWKCDFADINGNPAMVRSSGGYMAECVGWKFKYPAIVIQGPSSNPVISGCTLVDGMQGGLAIRDYARPIIEDVKIVGVRKSAFSISDFAQPVIGRYDVQDCEAKVFSVCNGATTFLRADPAAAIELSEMMCEGKIESAVGRSCLAVEFLR